MLSRCEASQPSQFTQCAAKELTATVQPRVQFGYSLQCKKGHYRQWIRRARRLPPVRKTRRPTCRIPCSSCPSSRRRASRGRSTATARPSTPCTNQVSAPGLTRRYTGITGWSHTGQPRAQSRAVARRRAAAAAAAGAAVPVRRGHAHRGPHRGPGRRRARHRHDLADAEPAEPGAVAGEFRADARHLGQPDAVERTAAARPRRAQRVRNARRRR